MHLALGHSNSLAPSQDHLVVEVPNFDNRWIRHPDTNIDLVITPLGDVIQTLHSNNLSLNRTAMNSTTIPDTDELSHYGVFQEIKFIGYPIGIWDEKNNLPIVRRGMTATDPVVDYNGRKEFLIDAAVFPGSSGSPVYIATDNLMMMGTAIGPPRVRLIGILRAVHEYTSEGKVEVFQIQTALDFRARTRIPSNLGVAIKATVLNDFQAVIDEIIQKQQANRKTDEDRKPPAK
jgi:hypothetical protein